MDTLPLDFLPETAVAVKAELPSAAGGPDASIVIAEASSVTFCAQAFVSRSAMISADAIARPKPLDPPLPSVVPPPPLAVTVFVARAAADIAPVVVTLAPTIRAVVS